MNDFRRKVLCAAMAFAMTGPVFAATYTCDNDPTSYPCTVSSASGWIYGTGSGDFNGDHRATSSATVGYAWVFNAKHSGTVQVYLNNSIFTDTKAYYAAYFPNPNGPDFPPKVSFTKTLNQNTAPGGWNTIGSGLANEIVVARGVNTTGADGIRFINATSTATSDALQDSDSGMADSSGKCGSLASQDPAVAAIQQKMLNAVDHYRDVQGSFHVYFANVAQNDDVQFQASPQNGRAWTRTAGAGRLPIEQITTGGTALTLNPAQKTYQWMERGTSTPLQGPRFYYNAKCEATYVHRDDPSGADAADAVILPENYAFWLSTSPSHVAGHEQVAGRSATVLAGRHDNYLGTKLGASSFRMWVDDQTGVLLKLLGSDGAGRTVYSIEVSNIRFDQGISGNATAAPPLAGWRRLD